MSIKVSEIFTAVYGELQDDSRARWTESKMLGYFNAAERAIVGIKYEANTKAATFKLVAGTKQEITGIALVAPTRNMGTNGGTPGAVITPMPRETLDVILPNWHADTASSTVSFIAPDPKAPRIFYCYPPQPTSNQGYVEILQAEAPTPVTMDKINSAVITLDDTYESAIVYNMLHQCFAREDEGGDTVKSDGYYNKYLNALGMKTGQEKGQ